MKKVLIITHYWPPAGGGGVQRWLKFSAYLPEFGWEPVVVHPVGADYPNLDSSLLADVSDHLQTIPVPIWEPYQLFKRFTGAKKDEKVNAGFLFDDAPLNWKQRLALWIRGNLLIPDPRVFWVRPTIRAIRKQLDQIQPDAIVTTGPPHSVHLIGKAIHRRYGVPWLADFRDPWSTIDYLEKFPLSSLARKLQSRLERSVLREADLVLTVSAEWEQELKSLGAAQSTYITNGYDEKDFSAYQPRRVPSFSLAHLGFISSFRNPTALWNAIDQFMHHASGQDAIRLVLAGNVDRAVFNSLEKHRSLAKGYDYLGYLPHSDVFKAYEEASVLILLLNNSSNSGGHIPGKLFEYLRAGKPILALGKPGGDVDRILQETGCGQCFAFDDEKGIRSFLESIYHFEWAYEPNHEKIRRFERRALTGELSKHLNQLVTATREK